MNTVSKQKELWEEYNRTKDLEIKKKLIIEYANLVKYIAGRLSIYLGNNVEYDDLVGYGIFGLIDAIEKFDIYKGVKFETYASLRIRGSIIDNLRKLDWIPRTLRQKNKEIEEKQAELEYKLGRPPTDKEVSEEIGMEINEYNRTLYDINMSHLISLDEYLEVNYEKEILSLNDDPYNNPISYTENNELKETLTKAIEQLSDREKLVITLYYFEDLTLKEISKIMKVSDSRVSQIHSKAVARLRGKLGEYKSILYE